MPFIEGMLLNPTVEGNGQSPKVDHEGTQVDSATPLIKPNLEVPDALGQQEELFADAN